MLDPQVKITSVQDQVGLDAKTLLPVKATVVTYMVGAHGPFSLITPHDQFTQEYVERETSAKAATLRALGAVI